MFCKDIAPLREAGDCVGSECTCVDMGNVYAGKDIKHLNGTLSACGAKTINLARSSIVSAKRNKPRQTDPYRTEPREMTLSRIIKDFNLQFDGCFYLRGIATVE